jgi:hypothetical protein
MKKQTVAVFLDISGAYDNVCIDVLCGVMLEKELPLGITLTGSATWFSFEHIFVQFTRIW